MKYYAGYEMDGLSPVAVFENKEDRDAWVKDRLKSESEIRNDRYNRLKSFEPFYDKKRIPFTYEEAKAMLGGDWFENEEGEPDLDFEQITWYEF